MMRRASLQQAQRVQHPDGSFQLRGVVYDDDSGFFKDGEFARTTVVVEEPELNLFRTKSGSLYRVKSWFPPSKSTPEYEALPADWPSPPPVKK